jgi:hypothetical protein
LFGVDDFIRVDDASPDVVDAVDDEVAKKFKMRTFREAQVNLYLVCYFQLQVEQMVQ